MNQGERSPLHIAAMDDDASAIGTLLADGESPDVQDEQGFTPLHFAAQQFSLSAASALLNAGATVDVENAFGNTALFVAVFNSKGRGELIKLLRSHGADPLHSNASGQTPVRLARLIALRRCTVFRRHRRVVHRHNAATAVTAAVPRQATRSQVQDSASLRVHRSSRAARLARSTTSHPGTSCGLGLGSMN